MNKVSNIGPTGNARLRIVLGKLAETIGSVTTLVKNPETRAKLEAKLALTQQRIKSLEDGQ